MSPLFIIGKQTLIALIISLFLTESARPPDALFGDYSRRLTTSVKGRHTHQNKVGQPDRVRILRSQDGDANVVVSLTFDQGQVCELEGRAVWAKGQLTLTADGLDETKPCQLVLRLNGSVLTLQDTELRCQGAYCGTRGAFDGARFQKIRRTH
ncbi:hypothetical protein [Fibrella aquatilis]|uniref:Uncharacterized protein n=1 Tax=Fibrella aquatilis TaxID=2817059 RepID=A0A939G7I7_9BACT|nr:hypothetical protein [Fibrella aquatilis]MBO0932450.1 hypothetical protein [Fibrella aquatilis]